MSRCLRLFTVATMVGASGCLGSVLRRGESAGGGQTETPVPPPPVPGPSAPGCAGAGPWRATILTREQYINAAGDLLGLDVRPLVSLSDVGNRKFTPGVSLTALQVEQRMATAEAIAAAAAAPTHLPRLLPCDPAQTGEQACADQLIERLGQRAFRRPPSAEAASALRALFEAGSSAGGFAVGVEWLLSGLLQSPDFLYHLAPRPVGATPGMVAPLDDHVLAGRLAFFLWNSPPDAELLAAAGRGGLRSAEGVSAEASRLLADPRAARARNDYYGSWLKLGDLAQISRNAPELNPAIVDGLQRSALEGIAEVYRSGASVEALLGTSDLFLNDALAKVYGLPLPGGGALKAVAAPPEQRKGILTHPAWLALLATPDSSDPIRRGLFVMEELLCQTTPDPIDDIPDLPALRAGLSTRARLEQHRSQPACAACHRFFDPAGMAFENYDAIGRYRSTDQGVPVDSSGEIAQGVDLDGNFASGLELLARLGGSQTVRDCMVRHWFEYAVSRHQDDGEACALEPIRTRFRSSGDLRELLTTLASSDAFRFQLVSEE